MTQTEPTQEQLMALWAGKRDMARSLARNRGRAQFSNPAGDGMVYFRGARETDPATGKEIVVVTCNGFEIDRYPAFGDQ